MSLKEQLNMDLKQSMKDKNKVLKSTITMVRAAILQQEKDNKIELTDEDVVAIVAKQVKQRKDVLNDFQKADRQDLVDQTMQEIQALQKYLPQQLNEEEITKIVLDAIQKVGANSAKDMGKVMGIVMPKVKGKADGGLVNQIVKANLI